ncbi:hypothetical protein M2448_004001, partial [Dysgonomonas sp. PF1-14]|nr:hypothetical protein [Dysgonomonas sp. PF1-14]
FVSVRAKNTSPPNYLGKYLFPPYSIEHNNKYYVSLN